MRGCWSSVCFLLLLILIVHALCIVEIVMSLVKLSLTLSFPFPHNCHSRMLWLVYCLTFSRWWLWVLRCWNFKIQSKRKAESTLCLLPVPKLWLMVRSLKKEACSWCHQCRGTPLWLGPVYLFFPRFYCSSVDEPKLLGTTHNVLLTYSSKFSSLQFNAAKACRRELPDGQRLTRRILGASTVQWRDVDRRESSS